MFKVDIKSPNGYTDTFDLSGLHILDVWDKFRANNIETAPFYYKIKDARNEESPVRIYSDSDMGNAALKLLNGDDTLQDAYAMEQGLSFVRDEIKDEIESNLLNEQYTDADALFDDIKRMTKSLAQEHIIFYCPLEGNMRYDDDGYYGEVCNDTLLEHVDDIEDFLAREQSPEINMAEYVGDHSGIGDRLLVAEWTVDEIGNTLYGRIDCYLTDTITPEETERLRNAIRGQNSDGFGEGFEQRDIPTSEGDLNVSFWHSGDDYFLYTQDEMDVYLSQQNAIKFGGMT